MYNSAVLVYSCNYTTLTTVNSTTLLPLVQNKNKPVPISNFPHALSLPFPTLNIHGSVTLPILYISYI